MTSRKTSDSTFYPFVPVRSAPDADIAGMNAFKDVFIVIQGDADAVNVGADAAPEVYLTGNGVTVGVISMFVFTAYYGDYEWLITLGVAHGNGIVELHATNTGGTVDLIAIVDSDAVADEMIDLPYLVEPARTVWYTEKVDSITFANITRLDGVEDLTTEIDLLTLAGDPLVVELGPGHNTEWAMSDGVAEVSVVEGAGLGRMEDFGDTVAGGTPLPTETNIVRVVNGLRPASGDIPIEVSGSLGIVKDTGIIQVVLKS